MCPPIYVSVYIRVQSHEYICVRLYMYSHMNIYVSALNRWLSKMLSACRQVSIQPGAFPRKTLQHTATHCNTLQHTATHCNTLQHTAAHCNTLQHTTINCNTLQHTATHCNSLQHTTTRCNMLQHTVTRCNAVYLRKSDTQIHTYMRVDTMITLSMSLLAKNTNIYVYE